MSNQVAVGFIDCQYYEKAALSLPVSDPGNSSCDMAHDALHLRNRKFSRPDDHLNVFSAPSNNAAASRSAKSGVDSSACDEPSSEMPWTTACYAMAADEFIEIRVGDTGGFTRIVVIRPRCFRSAAGLEMRATSPTYFIIPHICYIPTRPARTPAPVQPPMSHRISD